MVATRSAGSTRSRATLHPAPRRWPSHPTDRITFMNLTCDPWKYSLTDLGLFNLETQTRIPVVF